MKTVLFPCCSNMAQLMNEANDVLSPQRSQNHAWNIRTRGLKIQWRCEGPFGFQVGLDQSATDTVTLNAYVEFLRGWGCRICQPSSV